MPDVRLCLLCAAVLLTFVVVVSVVVWAVLWAVVAETVRKDRRR